MKNKKKEEYMFGCDWINKKKRCRLIPYAEVYPYEEGKDGIYKFDGKKFTYPKFSGSWYYLCFYHFCKAKLRGDTFAYCKVSIKDIIRQGEYEDD